MIAYLDCCSGVSGDMLLGALVDAGLGVEAIDAVVAGLGLTGEVRVRAERVPRAGLMATRVHVEAVAAPEPRSLETVTHLIRSSSLPPSVRSTGVAVLTRIAEAEGEVHGVPAAEVELHEVGALDAIVDVVATVAGLEALGVTEVFASALPVAPGEITHGDGHLPVPAPATLTLLAAARAPIRPGGRGWELVTPTGAALTATLARFEQPAMRLERVGCGAGAVDLPWPNVLRLWLGVPDSTVSNIETGHVVLETNIDDMSPQLLAAATEALFAAGALDATVAPLSMKKGRPGWLLTVVARAADEPTLARVILRETTTLGVRVHAVRRHAAERRLDAVDTPYGRVVVKLKLLDGSVVAAMPEFESVRQVAAAAHTTVAAVHAAASGAATTLVAGLTAAARDETTLVAGPAAPVRDGSAPASPAPRGAGIA
jgi:uncharacterized protein (TIGR00299 family) protein